MKLESRGAWGIYRDGELYAVELARFLASEQVNRLRPGSKHEWRLVRIWIEPNDPRS